jgi:hypothetical protein
MANETVIQWVLMFDGAKLMGEHVFDMEASSSSLPGNGARKLDGAELTIV